MLCIVNVPPKSLIRFAFGCSWLLSGILLQLVALRCCQYPSVWFGARSIHCWRQHTSLTYQRFILNHLPLPSAVHLQACRVSSHTPAQHCCSPASPCLCLIHVVRRDPHCNLWCQESVPSLIACSSTRLEQCSTPLRAFR